MGIDPQVGTLFQSKAVAGVGNTLAVLGYSDAVDDTIRVIVAPLTIIYVCVSRIRSRKVAENTDDLAFFCANIAISVLNIGFHQFLAWITADPLLVVSLLAHKLPC